MRHIKGFRTLNRTHEHRKALYKNMVTALLRKERIKTTLIKAKEIRRVAEKMITKARVKSLHNIRIINRVIKEEDILMKLFNEIAPRYVNRNGGYTRIIKLKKRMGDGADMAYLELVEESGDIGKKKKSKSKKPTDKKEVEKKDSEKNEIVDKSTEETVVEEKAEVIEEKLENKEEKTENKEDK
jgi:large subunit ribosomal protein L17